MVIIWGLIGFGNLVGLLGLWLFLRARALVREGETVRGVVVALVEDADDHVFAPVVRFHDAGRPYEFQHPIYQNPPYRVGDEVKVIYRRERPDKAKIRSAVSLYLWPAVLWIGAASLVIAGLLVYVTE